MSEVRDESSALEAAAEAAGAGDFSSAERYLNRAVELEEASFGPLHPDLANVLNNLGVVYEHLERPAKADACYRRAYAIAIAAFPPDDPAVVMSEKNLREFCAARGIPFEKPAPALAPVTPAVQPPVAPTRVVAETPAAPVRVRASDNVHTRAESGGPAPAPRPAGPVSAPRGLAIAPRTLAIAALVALGVIVGAIVIGTRSRSTSQEPTTAAPAVSAPSREGPPTSATPAAPRATSTAPSPGPPPERKPAPQPTQPAAATTAAPTEREAARPRPDTALPEARRNVPKAVGATPTVVSAQLCRTIETGGDWRCTPVTGALEAGPVFFYTRLKSPSDTKVEHRWYRGNRLQQAMTLRVQANQGTGYRTYSRATVGADRTGEWRVELRAMDGTVLHEERFTVGGS